MTRLRFDGDITGIGTSSGTRLVVGHWPSSHLGEFTDVMMEFADGHRVLLAPSEAVRDFVTTTYTFDETRIDPVTHSVSGDTVTVVAGDLTVKYVVGSQTALGRLLGLVPGPIATAPWFATITDPIARIVLRGVRTRGTAGFGRREYYGARDQRRVTSAEVIWKGDDMGHLAPVTPPVTFGFGSTPAAPSTTRITTTIDP